MKKRSLLLVVLALLIAIPVCIAPTTLGAAGNSEAYDWTMFRHDPSHSGFTAGNVTDSAKLSWVFSTGGFVRSAAAVANGNIFFGSWDGFFYCLNSSSGNLVWKYAIRQVIASSPAVYSGNVYFGADDGYVYALNASTGAFFWRTQIGGEVRSSPMIVNGCVYIGSGNQNVYALDAETGAVVWSFATSARVDSSPAVSNGVVYIAADDYNLYALNAATGKEIWQVHTGATKSSPSLYEGYVFVGSDDGYVYCLNASTGAVAWKYLTQDGVSSSPALAYGCVYIGSEDNSVYCLNASTGKLVWQVPTGFWVRSSPSVDGGYVYVGSFDYSIYCLNAFTGEKEWSFATGDYVESAPTIASGTLYMGSDDYHIYAFTIDSLTSEPLHQFFNSTLSWTTVAFDAMAAAVAFFVVFLIVREIRFNWRNPSKSETDSTFGKLGSWFSVHHDSVFLVAILALSTIFFINLGSGHMWMSDEQAYSQWANHMVKSGDYLTPWADGFLSFYLSKPPLNMWLMALSYQAFGVTNFASRLAAAVLGTLTLVAVFFLGKRLYNSYVGFMSAIILATFSTFFVFARHAMTDVPFVFFAVCSIYFFVLSENSEKTLRYAAFGGIFFGLAFMTKQVESLLVVLILFVYLVVSNKSFRFLFTKRFTLFWGIGLLVFSPWLIYMTASYGVPFLQGYFGYSTIARIVAPVEGHSAGFLYYFTYIAQNENLLWVILLPVAAVVSGFKAILRRSNADTLLIVWMAVVLLFFTFAQTRIYWYILPAFPAFAVAIGSLIYQILRRIPAWHNILHREKKTK